jgi:FkbM family methyltransferase
MPLRQLKKIAVRLAARTYFQPFFRLLHYVSLAGMNIGAGSDTDSSGEQHAISMVLKRVQPNRTPVIFDVGANKGEFTKLVLRVLGNGVQVYCFEPSVTTFVVLEKALKQFSPNVHLNNFGLGARSEQLTLYSDQVGSGTASLYRREQRFTGLEMRYSETVSLRTLDEYCAEQQITFIDYLKLDVEGHELSVLAGARGFLAGTDIDMIQFEFGGCNVDSRTYLRDFFTVLGDNYQLYRIVANGLTRIEQYDEKLEIFTTTNYVAIRKNPRCACQ